MNQVIKTGADPRALSNYQLLRDEISKLTHPARPDVDWLNVENLTLGLFEQNGVELQSAAWFTLARTHNIGLIGLNEGLSLIDALIVHQWSVFWPLALEARADILNTLFRRLQSHYRSWKLEGSEALSHLLQTEQHLMSLREALLRFGVKEFAQANTLLHQVKHSITRLQESLSSPLQVIPSPHPDELDQGAARVYVVYPEQDVPKVPRDPSFIKPFLSGACCALFAGTLVLGGGMWFKNQHQQQQALQQAHTDQQRKVKQAIPLERLESWNRGMVQLENMAAQLNNLDKTKGKYLTVSELKTGIFSAIQAFNQHIPVEEQLRRYAQGTDNQLSEETQTGLLLNQLMFRYQLLQQEQAQADGNKTKSQSKSKSYQADF